MAIEIKVTCPITLRKETVYYYVDRNNEPLFNGCDNHRATAACKKCEEETKPAAEDYLKWLLSDDPFLNQP